MRLSFPAICLSRTLAACTWSCTLKKADYGPSALLARLEACSRALSCRLECCAASPALHFGGYPVALAYSLSSDFPGLAPVSAIYLNYLRLRDHPTGVHRHTVVTLLSESPQQGLDVVHPNGTLSALCLWGNDVAATRPGLAQFLAYPATANPCLFTSTTTTTSTAGPGISLTAPDTSESPSSAFPDLFTVFDAEFGYRTFPADNELNAGALWEQARSLADPEGRMRLRELQAEINCLPTPNFHLSPLHTCCGLGFDPFQARHRRACGAGSS